MQQFKRADPERLQHASEGCSLEATLEENAPEGPAEEMTAGNGTMGVLYIPIRDEFELWRKGGRKEPAFLELLVGGGRSARCCTSATSLSLARE